MLEKRRDYPFSKFLNSDCLLAFKQALSKDSKDAEKQIDTSQ